MTEATVTIQGQGSSIESRLIRAQALAGSLFLIFLGLHLVNLWLAPFGVAVFDGYQGVVRVFYQHPIVETLLVILPVVVHAVAGIWLFVIRRNRGRGKRSRRATLHSLAGLFLLIFIVGHVLAVRGSSFFFDVFPEFAGLSFSLWYFPAYFYPYYFLLALAGFYHGSHGLLTLLRRAGTTRRAFVPAPVLAAGAVWILVSLLAIDGRFFDVPGRTDNAFGRLAAELTGLDITEPWK